MVRSPSAVHGSACPVTAKSVMHVENQEPHDDDYDYDDDDGDDDDDCVAFGESASTIGGIP